MAALWWHSEVRQVSEALSGIGELKRVISGSLGQRGFTDVRVNDLEVAGGKNACWVSIAHFHIADRQYWEVVMGTGDNSDTTRATVDEVVALLRGLRFL
jgi:hypothetical protein